MTCGQYFTKHILELVRLLGIGERLAYFSPDDGAGQNAGRLSAARFQKLHFSSKSNVKKRSLMFSVSTRKFLSLSERAFWIAL